MKMARALIVLLGALVPTVSIAQPSTAVASAATATSTAPAPVTLVEYRQLRAGMSMRQAHEITGTPGVLFTQGHGYMNRDYRGWRTARGQVWVHVTYQYRAGVWRLQFKSAQVPTVGDGW